MQEQKKKILFLVPYPFDKAPSQRLKFEQYYKYFENNGFAITKSSFISEAFWKVIYKKGFWMAKLFYTCAGYFRRLGILFSLRKYDIVYIHLWVTPLGPPFFEWLVCKISRRTIYDIDDLIYIPKTGVNHLILKIKGKNKPLFLMRKVDHVITCTPYLDQFVRKYNSNTTDISSTIDTNKYRPRQDYTISKRKIVLGWSGSHTTAKYLYLLTSVFKALQEEGIAFKLLVLGDTSFSIDGIDVVAIEWRESYEVKVISQFDIGLYPLPDEEWVYGKSGLKALQYMAAGIPTIATAIGTNFRIIENGVNGFLVKTDEEWRACIKKLIEDEALRKQIGQKGGRVVEDHFSVHANEEVYLSVLQKVLLSEPANSNT
jgi:L-malate glycosyltransferase